MFPRPNHPVPQLLPFFIAIIVPEVDASAQWYVDNLGFEIIKTNEYPDYGMKAKILRTGDFQIEMFEHKDAIDPNEFIPDEENKMLQHGLFKYGFITSNAEELLNQLKGKNVPIYREMYEDVEFGYKYFFVKDYSGNIIQIFEKLSS